MVSAIGSSQRSSDARLVILGGFRLMLGGRCVPERAWQRRSAKRLVKLLAVTPAHQLHREQIQDLLWPDLPPDRASNALRKALHLARRAFEPDLSVRQASTFLLLRDDLVQLDSENLWVDAAAFQAQGEAALASGNQTALERAIEAYGGELLPEDRYEDWTAEPRAAWTDLHLSLLRELAAVHERAGRPAAAIECLKQIVTVDPCREQPHRQIMRLLAASGQRHQALRQYHACRSALAQHLDAEPDPLTELLHQEILAGRVDPATVTAPGPTFHASLPPPAERRITGPLVGRPRAVATLVEALGRAEQGRGETILVSGEAGIGKSRLVAEAAQMAVAGGGQVLWGTCYDQEGQLPYGPLAEALDRVAAALDQAARHQLTAAYPELAHLVPAIGSASPPPSADSSADQDRARLYADFARILDEIRSDRVLLLVIDDLHAADTATLQVLHHLARRATERPWLVIGTVREEDVELGSEVHRFRAALAVNGLGRRLDLGRLTKPESDHLIESILAGGAVPDSLRELVHQQSLGNPLYAQEVVRAMRDQDLLSLEDGQWTTTGGRSLGVPPRLRDHLDARIDRLGGEVRDVLALVATAGKSCSFQVLRDTDLVNDAPLFDALDRALSARLLEERDAGYGFCHPLVRSMTYESLSQPRRALLHTTLASAIERRIGSDDASPEHVEELAHHWAEAGRVERAVPYLAQAADNSARVYANEDAIARLRRAVSLLDRAPDVPIDGPVQRTDLLERLGDLLALTGDSAQALANYDAALGDLHRSPGAASRLIRKSARQALITGDLSAADNRLAAAEHQQNDQSPAACLERSRLLTVRAQAHYLGSRFPEALAAAEEAARLAETVGSPADVVEATQMMAMACLTLGQWRRGMEYERTQARLTDLNQFIRNAADVHLCLGEYYVHRDPDQAVRTARTFIRAVAESERIGAPRSLALCHYYLGYAAYVDGRFAEAMSHLTESIRLYAGIGSASGEAIARMMRGVTKTALGQLDAGHRDLERGLQAAERATLRSHAMIRLYAGLGRNRLDANDLEGARRYVEAGLALADEPSTCICYGAIRPIASIVFALTGDADRAAVLSEQALAQSQALNSPGFLNWSYQARAIGATMTGDWSTAFAALDVARGLTERHNYPYERGRILLLRAFVHMQRRQPRDLAAATALMAEATPVLVRLGVRASAAQARSSLGFVRNHLGDRPVPTRVPA